MKDNHSSVAPFEIPTRPSNGQSLDAQARRLRVTAAHALLAKHWVAKSKNTASPFIQQYTAELPLPGGATAIAFNDAATDLALRRHVLTLTDPWLVAFLGMKVTEQSYQQFLTPDRPDQPVVNLIVAKEFGTFFTPPDVAVAMAELLLETGTHSTVVDPCAGSGALLCALLLDPRSRRYTKVHAIELDDRLATWSRLILKRVAELTAFGGDIRVVSGDGLAALSTPGSVGIADPFDVLINPPYGRLRFTRDRATNRETAFDTHRQLEHTISKHRFRTAEKVARIRDSLGAEASTFGILEHSKLFMRACAGHCASGSTTVIISPDSWMSGMDSAPLRRFLVRQRLITKIVLLRESSRKFTTVNQATAITVLNAREKKVICVSSFSADAQPHLVPYKLLTRSNTDSPPIPRVSGSALDLYIRLDALPKFGEQDWLTNARGELDQTLNKTMFRSTATTVPLVRGEHVTSFRFEHSSTSQKPSYVDPLALQRFLAQKPKAKHFSVSRIVGRQCSYAQQSQRMYFCRIPGSHAVGNSCNYLAVADSHDAARKELLVLGLLNSAVLDWFFRIENSNNHVANYEIDNLPFPADSAWLDYAAVIAAQLERSRAQDNAPRSTWLKRLLDAVVCLAYDLTTPDATGIVLANLTPNDKIFVENLVAHFSDGVRVKCPSLGHDHFNDDEPSLSELDRAIIACVPEGGNWQDIPTSIPSARLEQIRAMTAERGVVRTTYYGRLRRDQPAYTINTYYNRPGNGTHIHPTLPRTLTHREAARLQSFPDSYLFSGPEGAIRSQIGNAVPPRLAYAIGLTLLDHKRNGTCVDVFCGGGGLSLGLEAAGWEIVAAIDHDKACLDTYRLNRRSDLEPITHRDGYTAIYRRDLQCTDAFSEVCQRVKTDLKGERLDLLVGGPPCQGFSHAGFRLRNDRRNDLAATYLNLAAQLAPRIFVLENVEGLATFRNGQVLDAICATLAELGYFVHQPIWKLLAEQFGVPQMRRRLFIVATSENNVRILPPTPTHQACRGRRSRRVSTDLFESTLPESLTVASALAGLSLPIGDADPAFARWLNHSS